MDCYWTSYRVARGIYVADCATKDGVVYRAMLYKRPKEAKWDIEVIYYPPRGRQKVVANHVVTGTSHRVVIGWLKKKYPPKKRR